MSRAVDDLLAILDLERLEHNLFRGRSPQVGWQRVFGGQVIGQALVAACRTVEGRAAAFAARLLPARRRSQGADHLRGRPHPRRPQLHDAAGDRDPARPADLLDVGLLPRRRARPRARRPDAGGAAARGAAERGRDQGDGDADDARSGAAPITSASGRSSSGRSSTDRYLSREPMEPKFNVWIRDDRAAAGRPGDPPMRARLRVRHDAARLGADRRTAAPCSSASIQAASLDHALWFHRPFRADDWLLYAQDSPSASGARGFSRGLIFTARRHASSPRWRRKA